MSESGCVGFLEGDQSAGELEEGEVVLVLLAPADEEAAVSVQPGVGRLDDPAAGAPAGGAQLELDLFAAAADVRGELPFGDEVADAVVVVAAVEAQSLRVLLARLGPRDRDRVERRG